jgi:uncharacterized repeat protein (TIGR03803 family)
VPLKISLSSMSIANVAFSRPRRRSQTCFPAWAPWVLQIASIAPCCLGERAIQTPPIGVVSYFVTDGLEKVGIGRDGPGSSATETLINKHYSVTVGIGWNPRARVRFPAIPNTVTGNRPFLPKGPSPEVIMRVSFSPYVFVLALAGCGGSMGPSQLVSAHAFEFSQHGSTVVKVIHRFKGGTDGVYPNAPIFLNGALYGTTEAGGANETGCPPGLGCGLVYKVDPSRNAYKVLYRFKSGSDGMAPQTPLVYSRGVFYGTTAGGGRGKCSRPKGCGTVFELAASGVEQVLYSFLGGSDGAYPTVGPAYFNGMLYGVVAGGGVPCGSYPLGCGAVYSFNLSTGKEDVLHPFKVTSANYGVEPGGLLYRNGWLYGTGPSGGAGFGLIYAVNAATGRQRIVYAFRGGSDGAVPTAASLTAIGNTLYGTTQEGGSGCTVSTPFRGCGTVFAIDGTTGTHRVLYTFGGGRDGFGPGALVALKGVLYGTSGGGSNTSGGCSNPVSSLSGCGTVFRMTASGQKTVLYAFQGTTDGAFPSGLVVGNGTLYVATTSGGGPCRGEGNGCGTLVAITL